MDQTLAQLVRQKYPGAYDDLSDEDLEAKVDSKYPGAYSDFPRTKAAAPPAAKDSQGQLNAGLAKSGGYPAYDVPLVRPEHFDTSTTEGKLNTAMALAAGGAAMGPAGAARAAMAVGRSVVGAGLGAHAGKFIGGGLGMPDVGETVGRVAGGIAGGINPRALLTLAKTGHGMGPTLMRMLIGSAEVNAPSTAVEAHVAQQLARKGTFASSSEALVWLKSLNPEQLSSVAEQVGITAKVAAPAAEAVAPTVAKVLPMAAKATKAAAPAVAAPTAGRMSSAVLNFAKQAAAKNPKIGEKIWMELDDAGEPIALLTPDQAGAAARAGRNTTWIRNIFR